MWYKTNVLLLFCQSYKRSHWLHKMKTLVLAAVLFLSLMIIVSVWNFVLSGLTAICFYQNRHAKWPYYATNLFFMTLNMCIMGFLFTIFSILAIVVEVIGSNTRVCQILLAALVSQLVHSSLQSTFIFIQRCKTLRTIDRKAQLGYTKKERSNILIFNVIIFAVSGLTMGLYFSNLQTKPNFEMAFCTMRMYVNSDSVQTISSLLITIPHIVNGFIFVWIKWHLAKKSNSSINPIGHISVHTNPVPGPSSIRFTTISNNRNTEIKCIGSITETLTTQSKLDHYKAYLNESNRTDVDAPAPKIDNRSVLITKALRDMLVLSLVDISMPILYTGSCITGIFIESTRLEYINSLFISLVFVNCSLKTTLMLFRYNIVRKALKDMLKCL